MLLTNMKQLIIALVLGCLFFPSTTRARLSKIEVDSSLLEEYNAYLKEEIEASMRLEPGVLTLYATAEEENPNKVTILEIYADEEAYRKHIQTSSRFPDRNGSNGLWKMPALLKSHSRKRN